MNYIYDIALNFQKIYCEFFEWKRSDKIITIRKIPIYRVKSKDYMNLKNNDVVLDNSFMNMLNSDLGSISKKICLVSDGNVAMGLLFSDNGKVLKRSSLFFDEEDEVCNYAMEFDEINISYIKNNKIWNTKGLRIFRERRNFLLNFFSNINDDMIWKYLYYECFGNDIEDIDKIKKDLIRIANQGYSEMNKKLFNSIVVFSKIRN